MCGILGIIPRKLSGFYMRDMDLLETMMMFDSLRGRDSAGAAVVSRNSGVKVVKHASKHVTLMFETTQWKDLRLAATNSGRFVFAHNRAATRGKSSSENAHPFVEGKICLVHNGTIFNQKELEGDAKFEVDSNAIAHALSVGDREEVLQKISGAFALIWFDNEEERLYAVRNDQRPLNLITTDDYYLLASEAWMVATPWVRQGSQNARGDIRDIRELAPGELLSWNLKGDMESKKLNFLSDEEQYKQWTERMIQTGGRRRMDVVDYSDATKDCILDAQLVDDQLEDCLPFVPDTRVQTPDEIKNLEKALAQRAQMKACALTQTGKPVTLTSTTDDDSNTSKPASTPMVQVETQRAGRIPTDAFYNYEESLRHKQKDIIADLKEFTVGSYHLVKIFEGTKRGSFVHFTGKIHTPGKPMYDATGLLPIDVTRPLDWTKFIGKDIMCRGVVRWCTETQGGPSVFLSSVEPAQSADVYGADVPWMYWSRALISGCDECGGRTFEWERPFTRLLIGHRMSPGYGGVPVNTMKVICPDCLKKVLPTGEIHASYCKGYEEAQSKREKAGHAETNRHPTVQNRQPVRTESGGTDGDATTLPAHPTVQ